jgi:general stress protein YciG
MAETEAPKKLQGFAAMSPEKRREISSSGGKAAHSKGVAHRWTSEQAKEAGKRGGASSALRKRSA